MIEEYLAKPDITRARRILAVQPHYDDNDIAAGGTLAALAEQGTQIFYLSVTDDLVGVIDQTLSNEEMETQILAEQDQAGAIIGVSGQYMLNFPDAGEYTHHKLRQGVIKHIRMLRPDFIFTCDPWLPYEAHNDHIMTGRAVAEAACMYNMTRLKTEAEVDDNYEPYELTGVVFYATALPNTFFDISTTREKKHKALESYRAQFSQEYLVFLHMALDYMERNYAEDKPYSHAEAFKALRPVHLHVFPGAMHI